VRTTLSLDDDLAHRLREESRKSGVSFKKIVNHFLRLGLTAGKRPLRKPFVVMPRKLKLPARSQMYL
jgi:hypothetical protein